MLNIFLQLHKIGVDGRGSAMTLLSVTDALDRCCDFARQLNRCVDEMFSRPCNDKALSVSHAPVASKTGDGIALMTSSFFSARHRGRWSLCAPRL